MPHCVVELSKSLSPHRKNLLDVVFNATFASTLFKEADIKVRILTYEAYRVGTMNDEFVHVTASILSGRTVSQKGHLSQQIASALTRYFADQKGLSITVNIVDMDLETYQKIRL
ncbi:MAG: 5-carboxymethyl-2-hydroxymuconate Delta-isomerase [Candidatus Margulisbacteria bacterium]|nr:5-carboxymethyl-2-hydroxymuconate Delta-isomerase [Candidatus Margulisiibacteriota bacterium]